MGGASAHKTTAVHSNRNSNDNGLCGKFGQALAQVVNALDPDIIVLGGGAGQVPQLKTLGRERLAANVFGPDFETPLVSPELGDSAGVFGAALLSVPG